MKSKLKIYLAFLLISSLFPTVAKSVQAKPFAPQESLADFSIERFKKKPRSRQWKLLPKQKWEVFSLGKKILIDTSINASTRVKQKNTGGFDPELLPASEIIHPLGQIIGSKSESEYLMMADIVYIRSKGLIQVGDTYAITETPEILKSTKSDRTGYSYIILGKVKILAVRDDLFLGKLISVKGFLPRGTLLIPSPTKIPELPIVAASTAVQGTLLFDHRISTSTSAQHKEVFVDRGSADGLKPGMIFRVYQHYDPSNDKKISSADLLVDAELQVTQVTDSFSTALVIASPTSIIDNSPAVLMTDVSDLINVKSHKMKGSELDNKLAVTTKLDPLEELDNLDLLPTLGASDKRKLHQLEKWQGNPSDDKSKDTKPADPNAANDTSADATANNTNMPSPSASNMPPSNDQNDAANMVPPPLDNNDNPPPPALDETVAVAAPTTDPTKAANSGVDTLAPPDAAPTDVPPPANETAALPPPSLMDDAPPAPPLVPVKASPAPLPPSASASTTQSANSKKTMKNVPPAATGEPAMPAPPPPEL